jgi:hypothetical protein
MPSVVGSGKYVRSGLERDLGYRLEGEAIDRYASRIAKHLTQGLQDIPDGIAMRLSQVRLLALMQRKCEYSGPR